MPIPLDEPRAPALPVLKRQRIGERYVGALVRQTQREVLKDNAPQINPRTGKPRQELVLTLVTISSDAVAGLGDVNEVPEAGDLVRLILRGGAFAQWLDAKRAHGGVSVGDIVEHITDKAQAYDANGQRSGPVMLSQGELDKLPRQQTVGVYATITLRSPGKDDGVWFAKAEAAYYETQPAVSRIPIDDDEPPF